MLWLPHGKHFGFLITSFFLDCFQSFVSFEIHRAIVTQLNDFSLCTTGPECSFTLSLHMAMSGEMKSPLTAGGTTPKLTRKLSFDQEWVKMSLFMYSTQSSTFCCAPIWCGLNLHLMMAAAPPAKLCVMMQFNDDANSEQHIHILYFRWISHSPIAFLSATQQWAHRWSDYSHLITHPHSASSRVVRR